VVCVVLQGVSVIGEGGASSWSVIEQDMDEDIELITASAAAAGDTGTDKTTEQSTVIVVDSDSEEEPVVLGSSDKASSLPTKPSGKPIDLTKAVKRRRKKKMSHVIH